MDSQIQSNSDTTPLSDSRTAICNRVSLDQRLQMLTTVFEQASEGIVITDADNKIVDVNRFFENSTGYSKEEVIGKDPSFFSSGLQDASFYHEMWQQLVETGNWIGEIVNCRKDGSLLPQRLNLNLNRNTAGEIQHFIAIFTDLTELKTERDKRIADLEIDALTGLPNKQKLNHFFEKNTEQEVALLILNVNNFSLINSSYGLDLADKLLSAIADQLSKLIINGQLYRLNADEFAILFSEASELKNTCRRIRQHFFLHQINVEDLSFNLSFTYGGAIGSDDLIRKSLLALKKAKFEGRGRFHLFSAQHDEADQNKRLQHMHWNELLYRSLNDDCLIPYFQGIRDNSTGKISHYETLIRMKIDGQTFGPYQFLQAAKLSGLLPAITRIVIDRSFALMSNYHCNFNINITEDDLNHHYLVDLLEYKSRQYNINPKRVTLEILEGVSASGKSNHIQQLNQLKAVGYQLAIDDFGTEYSNFERILELDVDWIKIDAKYIKNIDHDKTSLEITRAIVFFADNANIPVVAEFVHNEAVQKVIESLGIQFSQGYLFSEPEPYPRSDCDCCNKPSDC